MRRTIYKGLLGEPKLNKIIIFKFCDTQINNRLHKINKLGIEFRCYKNNISPNKWVVIIGNKIPIVKNH